jgi:hypothetical protein
MTAFTANISFGDPVRPFTHSFWGTPLPDNASVDLAVGPAVVSDVSAQAKAKPVMLNVNTWTAEPLMVPSAQPLVPVTWSGGPNASQIEAVLALGVPIPVGTRPTADSDATLTIWQPDYVSPKLTSNQGRYYELWKASVVVDSSGVEHWSAANGCRMTGVNNDTHGHTGNWVASGENPAGYATDPDSTYQLAGWGIQGSGLPYLPGVLTVADCRRGFGDHALLLEVVNASAKHVWPASRTDGTGSNPVQESSPSPATRVRRAVLVAPDLPTGHSDGP